MFQLRLPNVTVASIDTVLGLLIDGQLSWNEHVAEVVPRCRAITLAQLKLRQYLTPCIIYRVIEEHFFPRLSYSGVAA